MGGKHQIVYLCNDALAEICSAVEQVKHRREVGGVLLGERRGTHILITAATTPGPEDESYPFRFLRKCKSHQRKAHDRWRATAHTTDWVGDWHSHPEQTPTPSLTDRRSWRRLTKSNGTEMVFAIQGVSGLYLSVGQPSGKLRALAKTAIDSHGMVFE